MMHQMSLMHPSCIGADRVTDGQHTGAGRRWRAAPLRTCSGRSWRAASMMARPARLRACSSEIWPRMVRRKIARLQQRELAAGGAQP
jgi:hypothetical protein